MGTVMIRCAVTGEPISTGIKADLRSFNSTPVFFSRTYCPFCRTENAIWRPSAEMAGAPRMRAALPLHNSVEAPLTIFQMLSAVLVAET